VLAAVKAPSAYRRAETLQVEDADTVAAPNATRCADAAIEDDAETENDAFLTAVVPTETDEVALIGTAAIA
jgi:hypothetical protein